MSRAIRFSSRETTSSKKPGQMTAALTYADKNDRPLIANVGKKLREGGTHIVIGQRTGLPGILPVIHVGIKGCMTVKRGQRQRPCRRTARHSSADTVAASVRDGCAGPVTNSSCWRPGAWWGERKKTAGSSSPSAASTGLTAQLSGSV